MTETSFDPAGVALVEPLFTPFSVGRLQLRNRIAMAPMTRNFTEDGLPVASVTDYYRRRAEGGAGLIITEGVAPPHAVAQQVRENPIFRGPGALEAWRSIAAAVHGAGSAIMMQLWHTGLGRKASATANPLDPSIGPSGYLPDGEQPARAMTERDFAEVIEAYGKAAEMAQRAGFDGVNIHAAHGYLIDQFFWERTNRRDDHYGGPVANRVRLGVEVVAEIRRRTGAGFPIMFRFSQWKGPDYDARLATTPGELAAYLEPLADAGVDIFDASTRRFWQEEFAGSPLNLAGWAKKLTGKAAMTVGSISLDLPLQSRGARVKDVAGVSAANLTALMAMFCRGDFDIVGVGRAMIANPQWSDIVRRGAFERLRPYDPASLADLS
jgi:2,4-dienoyl-CoA reductase-like NADH-dependent reductase (Old Yellow Enzyme family)